MRPHFQDAIVKSLGLTLFLCSLVGCGADSENDSLPAASIAVAEPTSAEGVSFDGLADPDTLIADPPDSPPLREVLHPRVVVSTNRGDFTLQLDAERAPQTVDNFLLNYATRGFYEGTIFHYVEPDFIVAAGGFTADLEAKGTRAPIRNEAHNGLKNTRGTVAMARDGDYADSATCQFFINLADNPSLDADPDVANGDGYCVFGEVIAGLEVLEAIAAEPVHNVGEFQRLPIEPVVVQSVRRID